MKGCREECQWQKGLCTNDCKKQCKKSCPEVMKSARIPALHRGIKLLNIVKYCKCLWEDCESVQRLDIDYKDDCGKMYKML